MQSPVAPHAGTISHYAYWIDGDVDNIVNVAQEGFNGQLEIDVASLSAGEHTFSWMVRDAAGAWSQIKTKTFAIDHATAIESITRDHVEGESWYSIFGQRLTCRSTQPGIYINNRQKVIVR